MRTRFYSTRLLSVRRSEKFSGMLRSLFFRQPLPEFGYPDYGRPALLALHHIGVLLQFLDRHRQGFRNTLVPHSLRELVERHILVFEQREGLIFDLALRQPLYGLRLQSRAWDWPEGVVDLDGDRKVSPLLIHLEDRHRRSVLLQGDYRVRNAGVPPLGELELLEKVTDPAVAVDSPPDSEVPYVLVRDAPVEAREARYLELAGGQADRNRLVDHVGFVVDGVSQELLDRPVGIVEDPLRLRLVVEFVDLLPDHVVPNVLECVLELPLYRRSGAPRSQGRALL